MKRFELCAAAMCLILSACATTTKIAPKWEPVADADLPTGYAPGDCHYEPLFDKMGSGLQASMDAGAHKRVICHHN